MFFIFSYFNRALPALLILRPQQWIKNIFVCAPLFFTPSVLSLSMVARTSIGVVSFCALSSSIYILNDYMDRESDRLHPLKCRRPLAARKVSIPVVWTEMISLSFIGLLLAWWLSEAFLAIAAFYFVLNICYSLGLKRISIIDVIIVSLGYVLRVYAGAELIGVSATVWIVACAGLISLFIALAKRRDDLVLNLDANHRAVLKGYSKHFIDACLSVVLSSLVVCYIIYTAEAGVGEHDGIKLFITVPFVIAGVFRYLQITFVEERSGSPTVLVLTDRFLIVSIIGWSITVGILIYG